MTKPAILLLLASAGTAFAASGPDPAIQAILWTQRSPEHDSLFKAAYASATAALATLSKGPGIEVPGTRPKSPDSIAVVLDVDETILDNSPFQAYLALAGKTFSDSLLDVWTEPGSPLRLLPGAKPFLDSAARTEKVEVFLVTNRRCSDSVRCPERSRLREALRWLGVDVPASRILLRDAAGHVGDSTKFRRYDSIAGRRTIGLVVGDQESDLSPAPESGRSPLTGGTRGRNLIPLPNAMYGSTRHGIGAYRGDPDSLVSWRVRPGKPPLPRGGSLLRFALRSPGSRVVLKVTDRHLRRIDYYPDARRPDDILVCHLAEPFASVDNIRELLARKQEFTLPHPKKVLRLVPTSPTRSTPGIGWIEQWADSTVRISLSELVEFDDGMDPGQGYFLLPSAAIDLHPARPDTTFSVERGRGISGASVRVYSDAAKLLGNKDVGAVQVDARYDFELCDDCGPLLRRISPYVYFPKIEDLPYSLDSASAADPFKRYQAAGSRIGLDLNLLTLLFGEKKLRLNAAADILSGSVRTSTDSSASRMAYAIHWNPYARLVAYQDTNLNMDVRTELHVVKYPDLRRDCSYGVYATLEFWTPSLFAGSGPYFVKAGFVWKGDAFDPTRIAPTLLLGYGFADPTSSLAKYMPRPDAK